MITPIELIQAVIDGMAERGFGRIVNITSLSVYVPIPGLDVSSGARAGLTSFLAGVARTVADSNVTINNLLPGKLDTDRLRGRISERRRRGGVQGQAGRRHSGQAARHGGRVRPDLRLLLLGPCRLSDRPEHSGRRRALHQRILTQPEARHFDMHHALMHQCSAEMKSASGTGHCMTRWTPRSRKLVRSRPGGAVSSTNIPTPGKLEIQATKPLGNQRDLALAYSPGVAAPCLAIRDDPDTPPTTPAAPIWSASSPTARPCSASAISARSPPSR